MLKVSGHLRQPHLPIIVISGRVRQVLACNGYSEWEGMSWRYGDCTYHVSDPHLHELALAVGTARDRTVETGGHVLLQNQPRAQVDAEHLRRARLDGRQLRQRGKPVSCGATSVFSILLTRILPAGFRHEGAQSVASVLQHTAFGCVDLPGSRRLKVIQHHRTF